MLRNKLKLAAVFSKAARLVPQLPSSLAVVEPCSVDSVAVPTRVPDPSGDGSASVQGTVGADALYASESELSSACSALSRDEVEAVAPAASMMGAGVGWGPTTGVFEKTPRGRLSTTV
jgi:hypothetical protein